MKTNKKKISSSFEYVSLQPTDRWTDRLAKKGFVLLKSNNRQDCFFFLLLVFSNRTVY